MYQILSAVPNFCRRYYNKHFGLFFCSQCSSSNSSSSSRLQVCLVMLLPCVVLPNGFLFMQSTIPHVDFCALSPQSHSVYLHHNPTHLNAFLYTQSTIQHIVVDGFVSIQSTITHILMDYKYKYKSQFVTRHTSQGESEARG